MPHDTRDEIVDFIGYWSRLAEIDACRFIRWTGICASKFYDWKRRYGKVNEHNHWIPRDFWLESWEKETIIRFFLTHPEEGYRRLAFMMLDEDVVAVSPSSVYRVLSGAGLLRKWNPKKNRKGEGFKGPSRAHEHWHIDVSYLNIRGTFYYLCGVLDGYSRCIVHWEIRESMTEADVEIILQRAKEKYPGSSRTMVLSSLPRILRNSSASVV